MGVLSLSESDDSGSWRPAEAQHMLPTPASNLPEYRWALLILEANSLSFFESYLIAAHSLNGIFMATFISQRDYELG